MNMLHDQVTDELKARFQQARRVMDRAARCDLLFVVGTSAIVYPAAHIPVIAKRGGAFVIEVNPEATPPSSLTDASILGKAGEVLPDPLTPRSVLLASDRLVPPLKHRPHLSQGG
ncbi:MAG: hypothetical protein HY314_04745 [Acidobacteria bacterium]|nr:hypothetical protein [Acidobacteriota bacterium]